MRSDHQWLIALLLSTLHAHAMMSQAKGKDVSFLPDSNIRGHIKVYVHEGHKGDKHNYQYLVDLNRGTIAIASTEPLPKDASIFQGLGHIDTCDAAHETKAPQSPPSAASPDGRYVVICKAKPAGAIRDERDYLVLIDGDKVVATIPANDGIIEGIAWSPNSKQIAILVDDTRIDHNPISTFSHFILGHSRSIERFKLQVFDIEPQKLWKLPTVREYSENGIASIEWVSN